MGIKKVFRKIRKIRHEMNKHMTVKGYRIRLKYMTDKDPSLQNGNRFFSRKNKQ